MKLLHYLLALLLALIPLAVQAQTFPALTGRVVDGANLLSPEQEVELTQLSAGIEQASGRQLVVAIVPDLQGLPVEDYGYRLGRAWKIGREQANNGVILLVAPNERKVRIEVGYGLEPIVTDALSSVIISQTILPRFKTGDMAGGIVAGAQALGEQLKLPLEAAEQRAKQIVDQRKKSTTNDSLSDVLIAGFWIMVVLFIVMPMLFGRARGRRYRGGGGMPPVIIWGGGSSGGSSWGSGGGSSWGGGGGDGGFSGGGGSFGGGGASGEW